MTVHFATEEHGPVTQVRPLTPEAEEWISAHMSGLHRLSDGAIPFTHEGAATFLTTVLTDLGEPPAPIPADPTPILTRPPQDLLDEPWDDLTPEDHARLDAHSAATLGKLAPARP